MPPRIGRPSFQSLNQSPSSLPTSRFRCLYYPPSRSSSAIIYDGVSEKQNMLNWLKGPGAAFKDPLPGSTNYLSAYDNNGQLIRAGRPFFKDDDQKTPSSHGEENSELGMDERAENSELGMDERAEQNIASEKPIPLERPDDLVPFPMNRQFRSQPVLSEELKDEIYRQVVADEKSVRVVSASLGVEMARVGAVVRLKAVEKNWIDQGKRLAIPYSRAVMQMLPQTPYRPEKPVIHESINDLPVHRDTLNQIFLPASESRHFTRVDAAKVFAPGLKPADTRVPHPELVEAERMTADGATRQEVITTLREKMLREEQLQIEKVKARKAREEKNVKKVVPPQGRWEFRFRDISVESVGPTGRDHRGVGARYGWPHEDRKRGQIKIPKRVE